MKTCLLLTGIARNVETAFPNILKTLIEPNDPDVFIHTWLDTEANPSLEKFIRESYKPKRIVVEKLRPWNNSSLNMIRMMSIHARSYTRQYFIDALYSAWYSIQQANLLKEQYRLENDLHYDWSIRARFDMNYSKEVNCNEYPTDMISVGNRWLPDSMVDDIFNFGPNYLMNIFCGSFNYIDYIHSIKDLDDGVFCGEVLVRESLKMFNIRHNKINDLLVSRIND